MRREEFVPLLGSPGQTTSTRKPSGQAGLPALEEEAPLPPEPLTTAVSGFWDGEGLAADLFGEVQIPPVPAALPKRLGNFPFWRGTERFLDAIEPIYALAAPRGMQRFLGEREPLPRDHDS
jgi:hypothetical protein